MLEQHVQSNSHLRPIVAHVPDRDILNGLQSFRHTEQLPKNITDSIGEGTRHFSSTVLPLDRKFSIHSLLHYSGCRGNSRMSCLNPFHHLAPPMCGRRCRFSQPYPLPLVTKGAHLPGAMKASFRLDDSAAKTLFTPHLPNEIGTPSATPEFPGALCAIPVVLSREAVRYKHLLMARSLAAHHLRETGFTVDGSSLGSESQVCKPALNSFSERPFGGIG